MSMAGSAFGITVLALLGGFGVLPEVSDQPAAVPAVAEGSPVTALATVPSLPAALGRAATGDLSARNDSSASSTMRPSLPESISGSDESSEQSLSQGAGKVLGQLAVQPTVQPTDATAKQPTVVPAPALQHGPAAIAAPGRQVGPGSVGVARRAPNAAAQGNNSSSTALPPASGTGKRVVFDMTRQRVWLVNDAGRVVSTYLVSGSLTDNLKPGRYRVFSRSAQAVGIDDSGTMRYFVRFTRGENAAIGFHDIPIDDGRPVQTKAQLGTPQSHGCIRQDRRDAIRLWDFAPIDTRVVVTP